jgi:ABC-type uncharacterized transport system involved in gliding motility auxiliary subunit
MSNQQDRNSSVLVLVILAILLFLGGVFSYALFPDKSWLSAGLLIACLAALIGLGFRIRSTVSARIAMYGAYSLLMTGVVLGLVGVLNFLAQHYPYKVDLTRNKLNTLSDQTVKLVKGLQKPVKAVMYTKLAGREQFRPLLDNYKTLNPKFEVEYVDPDKEPSRAKQAGIKKYGTLQLLVGPRDAKVEEVNEEKVTNALIKLLKDKVQTLCAITGHGEKNFASQDAEGYAAAKSALTGQAYEFKDLNLLQDTKVPEVCDAIAIIGPTKSFFPQEIKALNEYLDQGGRAIIAVDVNLKGNELSPEIQTLLNRWYVKADQDLIVDPLSKMLGVDAAVPILATYSKDNPITKDFQTNCYFPFARSLQVMSGAPAGLHVQWLAQTTPKSWGEVNLKELASGAVKYDAGQDKAGPLNAVIAVEGKQKDSKASRNTRMVVFGTSQFATNNYSRFGGNLDFFTNAASWLMEDESLISIRTKEEEPTHMDLSPSTFKVLGIITVFLIPALIAATGIAVWAIRRKL